jgi:hypothetical protein
MQSENPKQFLFVIRLRSDVKSLVAALVQLGVDVIVTITTPAGGAPGTRQVSLLLLSQGQAVFGVVDKPTAAWPKCAELGL